MIEIFVPRENVNDDSVIVRAVHYKTGNFVNKGQIIVEIETSKTNIDIESPEDGVIAHDLEVGNEIEIGSLLFSIGKDEKNNDASKFQENKSLNEVGVKISKAARKRANELGVSVDDFGPGWITIKDVEKKSGIVISNVNTQKNIANDIDGAVSLSLPIKKESFSKRKQAEIQTLQLRR